MNFSEKKYQVTDRHGNTQPFTAHELYAQVLDDSRRSDYDWVASATELFRVCNSTDFPERFAVFIKTLILNCFANLESRGILTSNSSTTDEEAVYSCYCSLPDTYEAISIKKVKDKYLMAVITGITRYTPDSPRFPQYIGEAYMHWEEEWKKAKFDEFSSAPWINFYQLRKYLYADFDKMLETAAKERDFVKLHASMKNYMTQPKEQI